MKKYLILTLIVPLHFAQSQADLKIGTSADWPPFNEMKDKQLVGFDIEIAELLCKKAQLNCQYVVLPSWNDLIPSLLDETVDLLLTSMIITEARKTKIIFSDRYYSSTTRMVKNKSVDIEVNTEGMQGRTVGVLKGSIWDSFVTDLYSSYFTINRYSSQKQAYSDLVSGKTEIIYTDNVQPIFTFFNTPAGSSFEYFGPTYTAEKYFGTGAGIGFRKGDENLAKIFSQSIRDIREDGSYQEVSIKYFGQDIY